MEVKQYIKTIEKSINIKAIKTFYALIFFLYNIISWKIASVCLWPPGGGCIELHCTIFFYKKIQILSWWQLYLYW